MTDLIAQALSQAENLTANACKVISLDSASPVSLPPPRAEWDSTFADCCTAFPLSAAKALGKPPRELAELLAERAALEGTFFASVEASGPGFLNFQLSENWYTAVLAAVEAEGEHYGLPHTPENPAAASHPLSDAEALPLFFNSRFRPDPELALRRDRANPIYRLRYACKRLARLPEPAEDLPFSPAEQALIKAIAAYPAAARADAKRRPTPTAQCLLTVADTLRRYHTFCRTEKHPLRRQTLQAARQVIENGLTR